MREATPTELPAVHRDSRLDLHELIVRREDEHVIAGRVATETFVALPEIAEQALALLAREPSVGEAEEALREQTGADVDLVGFAGNLVDLGFVRAVDGRPAGAAQAPVRTSLPWLRPEHCRWLFGAPAKLLFGALLLAAIVTLALDPDLVPRASDFFWNDHTSLVLAGNTVMFLSGLALHEISHLAAARSVGASGRFSLGTRLNKLAAQTDVTGLWAVPRRERYRTYLAGMACDLLLVSLAVLTLAHLHLPTDLQQALSAFVLLSVFRLGSQLQLYMRTDIYFVLADLLRAKNLMQDAAAYVLSQVGRVARAAVAIAATPAAARRAAVAVGPGASQRSHLRAGHDRRLDRCPRVRGGVRRADRRRPLRAGDRGRARRGDRGRRCPAGRRAGDARRPGRLSGTLPVRAVARPRHARQGGAGAAADGVLSASSPSVARCWSRVALESVCPTPAPRNIARVRAAHTDEFSGRRRSTRRTWT